ncbi:MAG: twin-arginine translocase subunit TatB [Ectothiorhodospiraceae bacterium]|nr:twin-arginine translocase subunit TatB [Ectothiorhodospiraceae bacterium]MCH8506651.1 Sec-independent protein translocase protein TatB [Ectothiorhodospiraceae bacterium]
MFDVSFQEVFLILLVALLVIGPERLPKVARTAGLWIGRARAMFNTMRNEVEREIQLDELRKAEKELEKDLAFRKDIERDLTAPVDETDKPDKSPGSGSQASSTSQRKYPAAMSSESATAEADSVGSGDEGSDGKSEEDHERKA